MKRSTAVGAALCLCAAGVGGCGMSFGQARPGLRPEVLENGVRLILLPSAGAARVGMEAVYSVGFLDEPEGLTQASHLLEHLVCMSGTKLGAGTSAPGEHWRWLTEHGMVNAETLGDFTHYDYEAPASELKRLLDIERARLEGLEITGEMVAQEVPRVYAETDQVESNPAAPLFKHALMAANQSWRYSAKRALVRGGLREIPIERLSGFHRATYRPERLTLVICGGFERGQGLELARASIGMVKPVGAPVPRTPIDWAIAPIAHVAWDANTSAVVLAFPPPRDATARLAVNLMGDLLLARLSADAEVKHVSRSVLGTNQTWPAGDLPFFLTATVQAGVTPEECARVLGERARALAEAPSAAEMAQLTGLEASLEAFASPPWEQARAQGERLKALGYGASGDPAGLVLLNTALRGAIMDRLVGGDIPGAQAVSRFSPRQMAGELRSTLEAARCRVVLLEPIAAAK